MKEQSVLHRILLACGHGATKLFRVNTGTAWQGKGEPLRANRPMTVTLQKGDVVLRQAQPIRMGLCTGGSDIIGWRSITVGTDDVGMRLAVFTAIEVKAERGRLRDDQRAFLDLLQADGGFCGVARSEGEAAAIISGTA